MKIKSTALKSVALAATITLVGCAEYSVNKLRNTVPQGSEFTKALAGEYLKFSESEYRIHIDDYSAWEFAQKGLKAAKGEEVAPVDLAKFDIPESAKTELADSRNRLIHALNSQGKTMYPVEAAKAQVMFDCWVEQQEENYQYADIQGCRDGFYKYVRLVELRLDEKNPSFDPALGHRPIHKVYFDTGSSRISKEGLKVIQDVAELLKKFKADDEDVRVFVYGHTDMSGSKRVNERLAKHRAENVRRALVRAGVANKMIDNEGKGRIEGPKHEKENRRVDIQIDVK